MATIGNLGSLRVGVEIPIKNWNKNYGKITADVKKYPKTTDKALKRAGKAWEKHAGAIKGASLGMLAFGAAAVTGLGFAVKAAGDFQQSMTNTQAVAGATSEELQKLTNFAREMGKQTVFSAKESADAMFDLASAGLSTNEIMKSLRGTMDLAAATQADLSFSASLVVGNLKAFDLAANQSGRLANLFTAAISGSRATMDKLNTSLAIIGPVAASINMPIEQTVGLLGKLFDRNIDASTSGTALRQTIARLLKPSEEAQEALGRLEVSVRKADGSMRPLVNIIRDLEDASLNTTDALAIFGVRAGPAMLALVNAGADSIEAFTEKITGTDKAAEIAALQINTFQGQLKILNSALSELKIEIGNQLLPVLTKYTTKLTGIINKTSTWAAENPKLTKTLVTLGGVAGVTALGLAGIGLAAPGIITVGKVLKPVGRDIGILGAAAGGAAIRVTALGTALATAGSIALATGSLWFAYTQIMKAANREVDIAAISTKVLTKDQKNLSRALEDIGIELRDYEDRGLDPVNATLGDLDINIGRLNRALGTNFDKTTNAERAMAGLEKGMNRTTKELNGLLGIVLDTIPSVDDFKKGILDLVSGFSFLSPFANNAAGSINNVEVELAKLTGTTRGFLDVADRLPTSLEALAELSAEMNKLRSEMFGFKPGRPSVFDPEIAKAEKLKKAATDAIKILDPERLAPKPIPIPVEFKVVGEEDIDFGTGVSKALDQTVAKLKSTQKDYEKEREKQARAEKQRLASLEVTWTDYGNAVIGVFDSVSKNNRIFTDTWIGTLTDWAIGNRRILDTVSDLWQGKATSIIGSAVSIFGTMTSLIDAIVDAKKQMAQLENAARTEDIERIVELRGVSFKQAAAIRAEQVRPRTESEKEAARRRGPTRRSGLGTIARAGITTVAGTTPPPATIIPFVPRRPTGTDRFGRPAAGTVAMAPARAGVGNVTFGDIIIQLPEGSEIQNMDSADWERVLRDDIQPAAEAMGLKLVRADNLLA